MASSPSAPVQLLAAPALTPFAPSSPGILATLPARALYPGETFSVALTAANPRGQGITRWSLPLRYDGAQLDLAGVVASELWLPVATGASAAVAGSMRELVVSVAARAAGQPPEAYRSSSSIALATATFVVRAAVPGTYPGAVSIGSGAALYPSWPSPPTAFYDHRGGIQASGSIGVVAPRTLGLFAWAERGDVFNTARFTGQRVATQLRAAVVRSWGDPAAAPTPPTTCVASAAVGALTMNAAGCTLRVEATDATPAKDVAFTLGAFGAYATAVLGVWQPARVVVDADDATLNSVLPLNAAPLAPGCAERYQAARLRARADWTNGGGAAGDAVLAADATAFATFASNDSGVVAALAGAARGVSVGVAEVGLAAFAPASQQLAVVPAVITVTDTPACLLALEPLATTGVTMVDAAPLPAAAGGTVPLSWRAAQALTWEGTQARVVTVARFSDGAAMDVSDRAILSLDAGGAAGGAAANSTGDLFSLAIDPAGAPFVAVNATLSAAAPVSSCGSALAATWEVCSRRLGNGTGTLVLALPKPLAIAGLRAEPDAIAPAADPAAQPPLSVPTEALLSLSVTFSDGSVRDFSADARTTFSVAAGAALCSVQRAGGGAGWRVTTTATGTSTPAGDVCTITARVAFRDSLPLSATVAVRIVALRSLAVYALAPTQLSLPQLPLASPPLVGALRLLRCDARNYDQRTLWALAALTNCSGPIGGCPLVDVNRREWLSLTSSNPAVFDVVSGYPSDPGARAGRGLFGAGWVQGGDGHCCTPHCMLAAASAPARDDSLFSCRPPLPLPPFPRLRDEPADRQPPCAARDGLGDADRRIRRRRRPRQRGGRHRGERRRHVRAGVAARRQRDRHDGRARRQHDGARPVGHLPPRRERRARPRRRAADGVVGRGQRRRDARGGPLRRPQLFQRHGDRPQARHQLHGAARSAQRRDARERRHRALGAARARHAAARLHRRAAARPAGRRHGAHRHVQAQPRRRRQRGGRRGLRRLPRRRLPHG